MEHSDSNPTSKLFTRLVPCWLPASLLSQNTNLPQSPQILTQNDGQGGPPPKTDPHPPTGHSLASDPQQDNPARIPQHISPSLGLPQSSPRPRSSLSRDWQIGNGLHVPPAFSTSPAPTSLPTTARRKKSHHPGTNATIYKHGAV